MKLLLNLQSNTQDFRKDYTNISYFKHGYIIGQVAKEGGESRNIQTHKKEKTRKREE